MNIVAIIPARYGSSRFPGKPLARLAGKEVINHVWERVQKAGIAAVVATDDTRIYEAVTRAGGHTVMTRSDHRCGTDRLVEAVQKMADKPDVVINVQGDEPFIHPEQVRSLAEMFDDREVQIATLVRPFPQEQPYERLADPSLVKVVRGADGRALYFSRQPIPFLRGVEPSRWPAQHLYYTHIGIYAYRTEVLLSLPSLPGSSLEQAESLEQLRWLQAGLRIDTAVSDRPTIGIDTPQDLEHAESEILKLSQI